MKRTPTNAKKVRPLPANKLATVKGGAAFSRGRVSLEVDEDGFIEEPERWSEVVEPAL